MTTKTERITIVVSIVALLISAASILLSIFTFMDKHKFIDITQKKHGLEFTVLQGTVHGHSVTYTMSFRNTGDYTEDIFDIRSETLFGPDSGRMQHNYCFIPFTLDPGEHRIITYKTEYGMYNPQKPSLWDGKVAQLGMEVRVANKEGLTTEQVILGVLAPPTNNSLNISIETATNSINFNNWTPEKMYTNFPSTSRISHNNLCSENTLPSY